MAITTAIAVYFLIWWVVLFAVLPWGVRPQGDDRAAGTDPGAPKIAALGAKLIWTTAIATAIFGLCAAAYVNRWVTLDGLVALFGMPL